MSYCHLSSEERYVISYLVLADLSLREIGEGDVPDIWTFGKPTTPLDEFTSYI